MKVVENTLRERLGFVVTALGYEFVGFELISHSRTSVLRVFIDSENGITVDDCSKVSYQVSAMLDVEDPIPGQYTLEISSPGLDRPLFEIAHYEKFVSSRIKVRTYHPINKRRNFVGMLVRVDGMDIHLLIGTEEVTIPFSDIEKANVVADIRK
jgi:ribosome maturation factor RimP